MMLRSVVWIAVLSFFLLATTAAAQDDAPQQGNVLTKKDLLKLSQAGVRDELIVRLIQSVDEVPALAPEDVTALRNAGVSMNVLTAVIQRRFATGKASISRTSSDKRRRIHVTASLHEKERTWWRRFPEKRSIDHTQVSWALKITAWRAGDIFELLPTPNCPKDPVCRKWSDSPEECSDLLRPDSQEWKQEYGCYLANKETKFAQEYEVFDVELPAPVAEAEIHPYFRDVENETRHWFTRHAATSDGKRVPGFVKLDLWGAEDFDLKVHIELFMSPGGYVQDLSVSTCNIVNRDEDSRAAALRSPKSQYCRIEESPF